MSIEKTTRSLARAALGAAAVVAISWLLAAPCLSCSTARGASYASGVSSAQSAAERSKKATEEKRQRRESPQPAPAPSHPERPSPAETPSGGIALAIFQGIAVEPALPPATLVVIGLEVEARLYVDGLPRFGSRMTLEAGSHEILVERFGFGEFRASASLYPNHETLVEVRQEPIAFAIESLAVSPSCFDPDDPGAYGSCEIGLRVLAPGRARFEVLDTEGRRVRDLGERLIARPYTTLLWDGRDDSGRELPAGVYTLRAIGADGGDSKSANVSITPGTFARFSTLYSGVSGALLAPDARVLGEGELETSLVNLMLNAAPIGYPAPERVVALGGIRRGLPGGVELGASGLFDLYPAQWGSAAPIDSYSLTVGVKRRFLSGPQAAALYCKLSLGFFLDSGLWPSPPRLRDALPGAVGGPRDRGDCRKPPALRGP